MRKHPEPTHVPCGDCHLCCKNMFVVVSKSMGDDIDQFVTVPAEGLPGFSQIPMRESGDCFYLGEQGCTIHDHAPAMCQAFSCIGAVRWLSSKKAREGISRNLLDPAVLKRGRELHRMEIAARQKRIRRAG